ALPGGRRAGGVRAVPAPGIAPPRPPMLPAGPAAVERLGRLLEVRLVVVLAQGVALEPLPEQDPAQVRVPGEADAHHVVDFALLELRPRPNPRQRRDEWLVPPARPPRV